MELFEEVWKLERQLVVQSNQTLPEVESIHF